MFVLTGHLYKSENRSQDTSSQVFFFFFFDEIWNWTYQWVFQSMIHSLVFEGSREMAPLTCTWRGVWQNRMSQNPQWYAQMFWLGNQASHHLGHEFDGNTASELLLCFIVFHLENMGDRDWWSGSTLRVSPPLPSENV